MLGAVELFGPRHHVGAVGVVFNNKGEVLLVEHVFRPNYNWGLPGGWVERGENPADTVRREFGEELGATLDIKQLLLCDVQGQEPGGTTPRGLALAYYGRLAKEDINLSSASHKFEILSARWVDPAAIQWRMAPFQQKAVELGKEIFEQEINSTRLPQ
jgi:8-oxo-dGTP pyrophosphatase MutT (NUDIX family)